MAARSYIRAMGLNGVYNEVDEYMAGQVVFIAGNAIPSGYLECNGATVSRTTYATLFSAIGSIYGPGDGATTFHLPDLRGEFIRGADKGRGVDSARAVGSPQGDTIRNITGTLGVATYQGGASTIYEPSGAISVNGRVVSTTSVLLSQSEYWSGSKLDFSAAAVVPTANENRPRNIAMVACIKY